MEKKYARLAALLAAAVLCGNGALSMAADWWEGDGTKTIKITAGNASEITGDVYGNKLAMYMGIRAKLIRRPAQ